MEGQHEAPSKGGFMSNKIYDVVKFLALIAFPAFGALYFSLAGIWGLPYAEQIVGTVTVVDTFLGVLLGLSKKSYDNSDSKYDGTIDVETGSMQLHRIEDPRELSNQKEALFKVQPSAPEEAHDQH